METRRHWLGLFVSLALMVMSLVFLVEAFGYPTLARRYPVVIAAFLAAVTFLDALRHGLSLYRLHRNGDPGALTEAFKVRNAAALRRWAFFALAVISYLVLIRFVGYLLSSLLLTCAFPFILGEKTRWASFLVFASITAFIYVVFAVLLHVPLPGGVWG